jgi:hypothetical protein
MDCLDDVGTVGLFELVALDTDFDGFEYYPLVCGARKYDGFDIGAQFAELSQVFEPWLIDGVHIDQHYVQVRIDKLHQHIFMRSRFCNGVDFGVGAQYVLKAVPYCWAAVTDCYPDSPRHCSFLLDTAGNSFEITRRYNPFTLLVTFDPAGKVSRLNFHRCVNRQKALAVQCM